MDHWPQGAGEIPERPRDAFAQTSGGMSSLPPSPERTPSLPTASIAPAAQNGHHRKSRAEVREMRRKEREEGVPFYLKNSDLWARVRDLPFTDRIMLRGIPTDMRTSIEGAIDLTSSMGGAPGITAALKLVDAEADLSDGICIAGFIWPALVRTEQERIQQIHARGLADDDVWLVEDLHPDEKAAYRDFVFRDREGAKEDTARLASFPGAGVAQAADRQDRPSEMPSAVAGAPDGGIGLRTRDAAFSG